MIRAALRTLLRKLREGFALLRRLPHIYYALVLVGIVGSGALTLLPIVADPNERWKIAVLGGIVIIVWTLVVLVLQSAVNRHAEAQAREIVADDVQPIKEELITLGGRLTTVEALLAEIQHRLIQINAEVDLPEMNRPCYTQSQNGTAFAWRATSMVLAKIAAASLLAVGVLKRHLCTQTRSMTKKGSGG